MTLYAGGDTLSRSYLSWGPPAAVHAHAPVLQSFDRSLEYDGVGRIRHQFTDPMPQQFSRIFGYDGLGRVVRDTGATMPYDACTYDPDDGWHCPDSTLSADSVRSLVYDAVGNVLRDSVYAPYFDTSHVSTGTYAAGNRITSFAGCSYATDADGNVTSRTCGSETVSFWWSSENRLDSLAVGSVKTRFYYDGLGRLVKRDANGTIHYFWWDGDNLYAELDGSGAKLMEYAYAGVDNPRALASADSTVYLVRRDGLGNVLGLVDSAQSVRADYDWYSLWGAGGTTEYLPTGATNRARFKGAVWMGDVGTDLYYMRARWYEPRTGRFLCEDPIGLAGGINPYVYVASDPVNHSDPFGECGPLCVTIAAGAIGGAIVGGVTYFMTSKANDQRFSWTRLGVAVLAGAGTGALMGLTGFGALQAAKGLGATAQIATSVLAQMPNGVLAWGAKTAVTADARHPPGPDVPSAGGPYARTSVIGGGMVGGGGKNCHFTLKITNFSNGDVRYDYEDDCGNRWSVTVGAAQN